MKSDRKYNHWVNLIQMGVFCLMLVNCHPASPENPPKIQMGADNCSFCGMIINEERCIASYKTKENQAFIFDDIGCLLNHLNSNAHSIQKIWVRDYFEPQTWLNVYNAKFFYSADIVTPMGSGIIATRQGGSTLPDNFPTNTVQFDWEGLLAKKK